MGSAGQSRSAVREGCCGIRKPPEPEWPQRPLAAIFGEPLPAPAPSDPLKICVEEEHILEYMASYLGIPEDAVPPPLRRFVSQAAPTVPHTSSYYIHFFGGNLGIFPTFPKNIFKFPENLGQAGQVTMGNPLYIRETLDQLLQDGNLKAGPLRPFWCGETTGRVWDL